jgi:hypothetical protein
MRQYVGLKVQGVGYKVQSAVSLGAGHEPSNMSAMNPLMCQP